MRFLFCSLRSPGYLNPAIGIAKLLRDRGHEVAFVSDISCGPTLAAEGLMRLPVGKEDRPSFEPEQWFHPPSIALQVKHILFATKSFSPDVLVGQHLTLGAFLAKELCHVPLGVIGFFTYLWPSRQAYQQAPELRSEADKRKMWRYEETLKTYNYTRTMLGLKEFKSQDNEAFVGDAYLLRSIKELEQDPASLPDKVHLVGDCLWEESGVDELLKEWIEKTIASQLPLIYVQHGRFFDIPSFWPTLIEVIGGRSAKAAASLDRLGSCPENLPANILARPYIPQGKVLPHARAVIASANTTVVLGALKFGVPSVLFSAGGEHPDVAEKCQSAGAAKILDPCHSSASELSDALNHILEDRGMTERVQRLAECFKSIDGATLAANLLEKLAETKSPLCRSQPCLMADAPVRQELFS